MTEQIEKVYIEAGVSVATELAEPEQVEPVLNVQE
jgi:hypothetical protein